MISEKYHNKYRIPSARAQWWDYGWNGAYYLTICSKNRKHYFGKIENNKMILSHTGVIVDMLWYEIINHHHGVELGDFVVMPNHIHGIVIIDKPCTTTTVETGHALSQDNKTGHALSQDTRTGPVFDKTGKPVFDKTGIDNRLETRRALSLQTYGQNRFQNIGSNSISSIVGSYKSAVTKHASRLGFENGWQTRFYDHIIRNDVDYQRISDYIVNNPANWKEDKFYN
jgi:REP element-mobilizing transposase RayT